MTDHISIDMLSEIEEAARLGCLVDEYQAINIERGTAWGNEVLWLAKEIRRLQTRRDVALQSRRRAVAAYREYKKRQLSDSDDEIYPSPLPRIVRHYHLAPLDKADSSHDNLPECGQ